MAKNKSYRKASRAQAQVPQTAIAKTTAVGRPSRLAFSPSVGDALSFSQADKRVPTPGELRNALTTALASKKPSLINCVIDPAVGTESGHIGNLNPKSAVGSSQK